MTEEKKRKQNEAGGENLPEKEEDFEIDPQDAEKNPKEPEAKPDENAEQEAKAESDKPVKDAEEEALNTKYMRLMADFQNFKRRTEKEKMEMILKQLQGVLEKAGVAEIKCLGEDFDPNFHNAVMTEDSTEYESGKVTAVLQKGYTLNGRVVRPVMVRVSN